MGFNASYRQGNGNAQKYYPTINLYDDMIGLTLVAQRTGLLVGGTAGAAVDIALKRLALVEPASTVVVLVCDAGETYLDSSYDDD